MSRPLARHASVARVRTEPPRAIERDYVAVPAFGWPGPPSQRPGVSVGRHRVQHASAAPSRAAGPSQSACLPLGPAARKTSRGGDAGAWRCQTISAASRWLGRPKPDTFDIARQRRRRKDEPCPRGRFSRGCGCIVRRVQEGAGGEHAEERSQVHIRWICDCEWCPFFRSPVESARSSPRGGARWPPRGNVHKNRAERTAAREAASRTSGAIAHGRWPSGGESGRAFGGSAEWICLSTCPRRHIDMRYATLCVGMLWSSGAQGASARAAARNFYTHIPHVAELTEHVALMWRVPQRVYARALRLLF